MAQFVEGCGSSITDFLVPPDAVVVTTSAQIAPGVKEGISCPTPGTGPYWSHSAAKTTYHTTFYAYIDGGFSQSFNSGRSICTYKEGANSRLEIRPVSTGNTTALRVFINGAEADVGSPTLSRLARYRFDVEYKYDGASGYGRVYVNSVLFAEFTGDTTTGGASGVDNMILANAASGQTWQFSGIISADEDITADFLVQHDTYGAGAVNTMDAGAYTDIDETGANDGDLLIGGSDGQAIEFTTNLPTAYEAGYTVIADIITARARKGTIGPQTLKLGYDIGGTDYVDAGQAPQNATYGPIKVLNANNPDDASAWDIADVDGITRRIEIAT